MAKYITQNWPISKENIHELQERVCLETSNEDFELPIHESES